MKNSIIRHLSSIILAALLLSGCQPAHVQKVNALHAKRLPDIYYQMAQTGIEPGAPLHIRIFKKEGVLETWMMDKQTQRYKHFRTYPICAFSGLLGPKYKEGDLQSPEGFYDITQERLWPASKYHLAMNIGYPNEYDKAHGRHGSSLMIHGGCKSEGCYAMTDKGIEEIYLLTEQALNAGQTNVPVHIFPFRMTPENLALYNSPHMTPFWKNLKQGYDLFEINQIPPSIAVANGQYTFPNYYIPRLASRE